MQSIDWNTYQSYNNDILKSNSKQYNGLCKCSFVFSAFEFFCKLFYYFSLIESESTY